MAIQIEKQGKRVYLVGDTYPIKDRIKAMGGHWDGDRRAWWVGSGKAAEAEHLANGGATTATEERPSEDPDRIEVIGKAEYKGRIYYVRWAGVCKSGQEKFRLVTLDGKIDFWADASLCQWVKRYEAREYRGRRQPMTLGGIRRYIDKAKRVEARGEAMPVAGCQACRDLGHMCERCRFDEFDN